VLVLEPEDDGFSTLSATMALALASAVACRALMLSASCLRVSWRSCASPMGAAQEAPADGVGDAGVVSSGGGSIGGGEAGREEEDCWDRDARLSSSASMPSATGPQLRSS
jgi:hypothetical protein